VHRKLLSLWSSYNNPQSFTNPPQTALSWSSLKPPRALSSITKSPSPSTPHVNLSDKLGRDGKLNSNEYKYCIDNNLCLYCGSKDHKVDGSTGKSTANYSGEIRSSADGGSKGI